MTKSTFLNRDILHFAPNFSKYQNRPWMFKENWESAFTSSSPLFIVDVFLMVW